jgi:hypothetical protein
VVRAGGRGGRTGEIARTGRQRTIRGGDRQAPVECAVASRTGRLEPQSPSEDRTNDTERTRGEVEQTVKDSDELGFYTPVGALQDTKKLIR